MTEIVKNPNQVRAYLDDDKKSMDNMFDLTTRNGFWALTVSRGGDTATIFTQDAEIMREFFEAGLAILNSETAGG